MFMYSDPRDKRPPEPVIPEEKPAFKAYKEVYDRVKLEVKEGKRNGENKYNVDVPPYTIHNGASQLTQLEAFEYDSKTLIFHLNRFWIS